ncbi:TetR/AcrR family transcriptional regulator [Mangrovihabitans endophyticus]|uniref:TetR family transcriptional regulator n=1 Tax=Mangrovihabitans endophyticus TaxID=1751298 RepID=A0A8J3BTX9_9ACTN|nr:TetR/AcrR family transcriptional regulator [Mangrovihabitans endophyticus]GGK76884.1 TetR family transcriptional regulator [Mangrovihabitans endophyticus]
MGDHPGLRERKKAATRLALHEAALRLAVEHGPDRVTVDAIADAASVSRRTFSNYFSSKEEALFHGDTERMRRMLTLIEDLPGDEPVWSALSRAAEHLAADVFGEPDAHWLAQRRRLRSCPGLVTHQIAAYSAIERELAAELARRSPGPRAVLHSRVLAATFLTTLRVAVQHWIEQPDRPLVTVVREALDRARPAVEPDQPGSGG